MRVLSLFDGISAGQLALQRAGIDVETYYASEIDKHAIQVTNKNFPNTVQLWDITKWKEWDIDWSSIDLVIGGSPCQGFSFAGKQLNFDDPRSALFFVFVDICHRVIDENPKMKFLLENVRMKKEYQDVITQYMGVGPIAINSSLVSAQNRYRLYWTNIQFDGLPENKNILLKDILEDTILLNGASIKGRYLENKATIIGRRLDENGTRKDYDKRIKITQCLEVRNDNTKSNCLNTVEKDNVVTNLPPGRYEDAYNRAKKICNINPSGNGMNGWVYDTNFKSPTLTTNKGEGTKILDEESPAYFRTLTPIECERLQTFPDDWTAGISNSQRYKALGNSWTVDVIAHIFKGLKS